ncbi:MAG: TRAM domain-containing protein [Candidatus Nitrosopolaris sp.]
MVGVMVVGAAEASRGSPRPKPVEVGKEYEVDVTDISRKGDGIARIQGFVSFIENRKIGHRLKVKVTEVADRFAKATPPWSI